MPPDQRRRQITVRLLLTTSRIHAVRCPRIRTYSVAAFVDFQIFGTYLFIAVGIADKEIMFPPEQPVCAGQVKFDSPLAVVFGMPQRHITVSSVGSSLTIKGRVIQAVWKTLCRIIKDALLRKGFIDKFRLIGINARIPPRTLTDKVQRERSAHTLVKTGFAFCGTAAAVLFESSIIETVFNKIVFAIPVFLGSFVTICFQFLQCLIFRLERDDFVFFGQKAYRILTRQTRRMFVFQKKLPHLRIGFILGIRHFGIELPTVVKHMFET